MDKQKPKSLNPKQLERYASQLGLPGMNAVRQQKLRNASILVIGLSPAGSTCALHLAQAGIGRLLLQDHSLVQKQDLSSHLIFSERDVNRPKIEVVRERLLELNPDLEVETHIQKFDAHNAEKLLQTADLAAEALENWQDKLLASDNCMRLGKPLIHSGIIAFSFHVFSMIPTRSACLRCVFAKLGLEDFPPTGMQNAVLGSVAGIAGAFQATEAIKWLTQLGTISGNHLLRFDVLRSEFDDMTELTGRSDCPDCGRAS